MRIVNRVAAILITAVAAVVITAGAANAEEPTPEPTAPTSSQSGLENIESPVCLPPILTGNGIGVECVPAPGETYEYPERTDGSQPGLFGWGIAGLL